MAKLPKLPPSNKKLRDLARNRFLSARRAEIQYQAQLSKVGKQIGSLVDAFAPGGNVGNLAALREALHKYSELLGPWAEAITGRMHADVNQRDIASWIDLARSMGGIIRKEIESAPVGHVFRGSMREQVRLIKSLPIEAALRVHKLTQEALANAGRASDIQREILRSGHVSVGRAKTIARTETSRTASLLTAARAEYAGSTHYIWHTSEDSDVRPLHRRLDKKIFAWTNPPITGENGERSLPGAIYNCRCWAEPIIADLPAVMRHSARKAA